MKNEIYERLRHAVRNNVVLSELNNLRTRKSALERHQAFLEHGAEVAGTVSKIFEDNEVECFLLFGSLLGVVREGRFLEHDNDVDFGIIIDSQGLWVSLESYLTDAGFTKRFEFSHGGLITEQTYCAGDMTFDIFGCYLTGPEGCCLPSGRVYSCTRYADCYYKSPDQVSVVHWDIPLPDGLLSVEIDNCRVKIPTNSVAILETFYGENWQIPDPEWKFGTGSVKDCDDGVMVKIQ